MKFTDYEMFIEDEDIVKLLRQARQMREGSFSSEQGSRVLFLHVLLKNIEKKKIPIIVY